MSKLIPAGVQILGPIKPQYGDTLSYEALFFVATLQRAFNDRRLELLAARVSRQKSIEMGVLPAFLPDTRWIRDDPTWKVAPLAPGLVNRKVEITGPVDRKMIINALNSGANTFMADFEDSNAPTWENCISGQTVLLV